MKPHIYTVPAAVCDSAIGEFGHITITWSFVHTGGRPLTSVIINYIIEQGDTSVTRSGPETQLGAASATIPSLPARYSYIPLIVITNFEGTSTIQCPRVELSTGKSGMLDGVHIIYMLTFWSKICYAP